jgi:hypothetical protein
MPTGGKSFWMLMIMQSRKSEATNKDEWERLFATQELKAQGNYKIFDSSALMHRWAEGLNWQNIGPMQAMDVQNVCRKYVASYPYTMFIRDDADNQPEPGS